MTSSLETAPSSTGGWVLRTAVALLITLVSGVVIGFAVGGYHLSQSSDAGADGAAAPAPTATAPPLPSEGPSEVVEEEPVETEQPRLTPVAPPGPLADVDVAVEEVATFELPTAVAIRAGDPAVYVAEKEGTVRVLRGGTVDAEPWLDLSAEVSVEGERGLIGLAFHPTGEFVYVNYTDLAGDNRLHEFRVAGDAVDEASRREVLVLDQPDQNHNSHHLVFGPDGMLYIGAGDGDSSADPFDNGQDPETLLGSILRIDPRGGEPYGIPADNPFVGETPGADEVYVYGLRNPWRFAFDRATGDLWIGDVGHDHREELNVLPAGTIAGANLGWNRVEGRLPFQDQPPPPADVRWPVYDYSHGEGCSVTGGHVYRGSAIPGLEGAYVFGDYCFGWVKALRQEGGVVVAERTFDLRVPALVGFAETPDGELYVLSTNGPLSRLVAAAPAAPGEAPTTPAPAPATPTPPTPGG